jgi:hypothetical protein
MSACTPAIFPHACTPARTACTTRTDAGGHAVRASAGNGGMPAEAAAAREPLLSLAPMTLGTRDGHEEGVMRHL